MAFGIPSGLARHSLHLLHRKESPSLLRVRQLDTILSKWSGYANATLFLLLWFKKSPGEEVFFSLCDRAGIGVDVTKSFSLLARKWNVNEHYPQFTFWYKNGLNNKCSWISECEIRTSWRISELPPYKVVWVVFSILHRIVWEYYETYASLCKCRSHFSSFIRSGITKFRG